MPEVRVTSLLWVFDLPFRCWLRWTLEYQCRLTLGQWNPLYSPTERFQPENIKKMSLIIIKEQKRGFMIP